MKQGSSHGPDNEHKQDKNKGRRKQWGNNDFTTTQFSAGGQQLYNDPPNGQDHNHCARMAMVLRDSALSLLIEISRAKHHPMERVNFTLGSISWRFGGHGFDVFESYTGRAFGVAPLCGCVIQTSPFSQKSAPFFGYFTYGKGFSPTSTTNCLPIGVCAPSAVNLRQRYSWAARRLAC
jgi:hypothetical protein